MIGDLSERLWGAYLDAGLASLALFGLTALVMIGCPQPARRLWLARGALVGSLVIPLLILIGAVPRFDLLAAVRDSGTWPDSPVILGAAVNVPAWFGLTLRAAVLVTLLVGLARLGLGLVGLPWLASRSDAPSAETLAIYDELAPGTDKPGLRVSERVHGPVLIGVFRPTILIPPTLTRPEEIDRLRLGLLHELAHDRAGDLAFGLVAHLARVLWFALPPAWWVIAQMRLDQEFLADRRASLGFGPPRNYASSLLDFTAPAIEETEGNVNARFGGGGDRSPLFQRVLMLVRCPFPVELSPPGWWVRSACGLLAGASLALSTISLRPTPAPAATATAAAPARATRFPVSKLTVPPRPAASRGRAPLFELPIRLPPRFDLSAEVWADPSSLARTRLVGLRLGPPHAPEPDSAPAWHTVRVRRDRGEVSLWVDGQPRLGPREDPVLTSWLSVEPPPHQEGRFRNLVLSW